MKSFNIVISLKKIILCVLSAFMCINMCVTTGLAKKNDESHYTYFNSSVNTEEENIVMEKEECLDESSSHFLMRDGTSLAVTYANRCAVYDENEGRYVKVDNTLEEKNGVISTVFTMVG